MYHEHSDKWWLPNGSVVGSKALNSHLSHVFCAENLLASNNSGWKGVHSLTLATQEHELTLLGSMNIDSKSGNLG